MKYYLIAGERSGDLHGANLIKALKQQDPEAVIRCWGGDAMQKAGGELVVHYRDTAFMGFWEVFVNLRAIRRFLRQCQEDVLAFRPDALILIDYAGFNLRIARFAKQQGLRTFYYISPKVWAWNQSRAKKIKAVVDHMFVILPFEKAFYEQYDYAVDYVGNPLLDAIRDFEPNPDFKQAHELDERPVVALLPGSREQEVKNMLDVMLDVVPRFPECQFAVAAVDNVPFSLYQAIESHPSVKVLMNQTYDLLSHADAAVVTSGTATLETALFEVPQVVVYQTSWVSYKIARSLIKVPYISLVNLIAEKEVVPELIQQDFSEEVIVEKLRLLTTESEMRKQQLVDYQELKEKLGDMNTSETVARLIQGYLR